MALSLFVCVTMDTIIKEQGQKGTAGYIQYTGNLISWTPCKINIAHLHFYKKAFYEIWVCRPVPRAENMVFKRSKGLSLFKQLSLAPSPIQDLTKSYSEIQGSMLTSNYCAAQEMAARPAKQDGTFFDLRQKII